MSFPVKVTTMPNKGMPDTSYHHLPPSPPPDIRDFPVLTSSSSTLGGKISTEVRLWSSLFQHDSGSFKTLEQQMNALNMESESPSSSKKNDMNFGLVRYRDSPFLFNRLPIELRQMVYDLVIPRDNMWMPYCTFHRTWQQFLPPLCRAAIRFYEEATPVYLSSVTLSFNVPNATVRWTRFLESLPDETGFKAVRRVKFNDYSKDDDGSANPLDPGFLARCPGIWDIVWEVYNDSLTKTIKSPNSDGGAGSITLRTVEEVVHEKDLGCITKCGKLSKFRIIIGDGCHPELSPLVTDLAQWVRDKYLEVNKRTLEVGIFWW